MGDGSGCEDDERQNWSEIGNSGEQIELVSTDRADIPSGATERSRG